MKRTIVKKILVRGILFLGIMILALGVHIYMVTRPKAPTAATTAMARIDFTQDINAGDANKITSWLYQQKGVDHVLCNEAANLVVFTFHPLQANADIIAARLTTTLHYNGHRFMPSAEDMKNGCPVATTSITYKAYKFIKNIFNYKNRNMKKGTLLVLVVAIGIGFSSLTSCKKSDSSTAMTFYDTLGGTTMVADPSNPSMQIEKGRLGLRSVVDSTIFVIAGDTALNGFFTVLLAEVTTGNTTGFEVLSKNLTDFFCVATGAKNFTYGGKNMVAAHDPAQNPRMSAKADAKDFDQFVADLIIGAKKCGLSDPLIARVGAIVGTLKSQVVQK